MFVCTLFTTLVIGLQGPDPDTKPWETVVSKEGQFMVDFPTPPSASSSKTETGPSGKIKVIVVRCNTEPVDYIAQKIILPTAVVRGAEERELDEYRDYFAKMFNGKVISEKKVRSAGHPGRDYTVRGQPERNANVSTIRVRQYLAGQSVYALIAVSAANRELPPEVGRFFGSFAEGTTRTKKVGPKPEAEAEGKQLAGWGTAIDPDADCKIEVEGKALVISIPATLHDLNADIDKFNAPRVLREVDGNFSVTVKVAGDFNPGPKATRPKAFPINAAGIFVWRDSDNYIFLERAAMNRNGKVGGLALFEEREGGSRGATHNGALATGPAYLRVERRGSRIYGFTSKDGKKWTALKPIDTVWPSDLKVGLNALNTSADPMTARFEEFTFKGNTTGTSAGTP